MSTRPDAGLEAQLLAPLAAALDRTGGPVLAAVSGGCDSITLLHALCRLGRPPAAVLHVDHGLRPESAADAAWVAAEAQRLGLSCRVHRVAVAQRARDWRCGLEEAGRRVRLDFFRSAAQAAGATAVLCAHHRDDQIETVLANCLRGADRIGQAGMAAVRPLTDGAVLSRPWLGVSRAQIRQLAREWHVRWREDASNADCRFRRNQLRHAVLPTLEAGVPGFGQALWQWSQEAASAVAALDAAVAPLRAAAAQDGQLAVAELMRLDRDVRGHCCRRLLEDLQAPISRGLVQRLLRLCGPAAGLQGARLHCGGVLLSRRGARLVWERVQSQSAAEPVPVPVAMAVRDRGRILRRCRVGRGSPPVPPRDPWSACIDADSLCGPVQWRCARPGERWRALAAPGSRSVLRWLGERGAGLHERRSIVLLADAHGPVWIPGHTIAERVRLQAGTRHWWELTARSKTADAIRSADECGGPHVTVAADQGACDRA